MEMTTNFANNTPTSEAASQDNFFWMKIEDFATQIRICSLKARCGTVSPKSYQKILEITKKIQSEIVSHLNQVSKANPKAFPPNTLYPFIFQENKELVETNGNNKNEFNENTKFSDLKTQQNNNSYLPPPNFSHTFNNTQTNYNFIPNNASLSANQGNNSISSNQTNNNNGISTSHNPTSSNPSSTSNPLNGSQNLNITVVQHDHLDNLPIVNGIENKDDKYSFTSQLFDKNLGTQKRQKRKRKNKELDRVCSICETSDTPEWRRGPLGPRTLCNACGLKWSKKVKTESNQKPDFSNLELTQPIEMQGINNNNNNNASSTAFSMQTNPIPIALLGPHISSTKPEDFTFHTNINM